MMDYQENSVGTMAAAITFTILAPKVVFALIAAVIVGVVVANILS